jgi:hypothetical protein
MNRSMRSFSRSGQIRLIALFELLRAVGLIVVGVGTLKLIQNNVRDVGITSLSNS